MYSDAVDKLKKIWEIMFILFFCLRLLKMVGKPIMGEGRFTNGGERVAFTLPPPPLYRLILRRPNLEVATKRFFHLALCEKNFDDSIYSDKTWCLVA